MCECLSIIPGMTSLPVGVDDARAGGRGDRRADGRDLPVADHDRAVRDRRAGRRVDRGAADERDVALREERRRRAEEREHGEKPSEMHDDHRGGGQKGGTGAQDREGDANVRRRSGARKVSSYCGAFPLSFACTSAAQFVTCTSLSGAAAAGPAGTTLCMNTNRWSPGATSYDLAS